MRRDSLVAEVTGCWLDDSSSIPTGAGILATTPGQVLEFPYPPPTNPSTGYWGPVSLEVNRPEFSVNHSFPNSVRIKNV